MAMYARAELFCVLANVSNKFVLAISVRWGAPAPQTPLRAPLELPRTLWIVVGFPLIKTLVIY